MSLIEPHQIDQFHTHGYFVTEVAIEPKDLQIMAAEMDRVYNEDLERIKRLGTPREIELQKNRRSYGQFHTRSDFAKEFVKLPIYLDACRQFIGQDADLYYNQAATKPPERGRIFTWHQDSGYNETIPLTYITCWTAISDSTLENGCIWVIPGSHTWGLLPHKPEEDTPEVYPGQTAQFDDESGAVPVEMKAGQIAFFSSLTLHRSGPNRSQKIRRGYVPQYHVPGVVSKSTGKLWGDQYPVLRNGKRC